jgi:hypothetical protein
MAGSVRPLGFAGPTTLNVVIVMTLTLLKPTQG